MQHNRHSRLGLALLATGITGSTLAQQQLDRITITGSSIKRVESETVLPVTVMTRDQIEKTGATNVEDILRRIGANAALQSDTTQGAGYAQSWPMVGVAMPDLCTERALVARVAGLPPPGGFS